MPKTDVTETDRKDLVQLVRFVTSAGSVTRCATERDANEDVSLATGSGTVKIYRQKSLFLARALGLVAIKGDRVEALPAARSFLKRALGPDQDMLWLGQHGDWTPLNVGTPERPAAVRVDLDESPLASISRLKDKDGKPFLPAEAITAGNRLHADFTRAQLQPRLTQSFAPKVDLGPHSAGGTSSNMTDSSVAARIRFNKAIAAMGPDLQGVAVDICCFSKGLETVEHERGWPQRSAKLMLRTALLMLYRHYYPPAQNLRPKMQHWGEDDFRPELKR